MHKKAIAAMRGYCVDARPFAVIKSKKRASFQIGNSSINKNNFYNYDE